MRNCRPSSVWINCDEFHNTFSISGSIVIFCFAVV
jgi:hypothetical protein